MQCRFAGGESLQNIMDVRRDEMHAAHRRRGPARAFARIHSSGDAGMLLHSFPYLDQQPPTFSRMTTKAVIPRCEHVQLQWYVSVAHPSFLLPSAYHVIASTTRPQGARPASQLSQLRLIKHISQISLSFAFFLLPHRLFDRALSIQGLRVWCFQPHVPHKHITHVSSEVDRARTITCR
jgi:hypothetical protein